MAYIYRRGKKWAYRAYAGKDPITGKDKQKSKSGFLTKKDAQLAAAIFERQFHKGDYIEPSALTMKSVCDEWLKHYSVDVKQSSINTRKIDLKHIKANFGDDPIQKITKMDYQSFIDDMSEKVSNNFVRGIHTTSKLIFEYAKEMKLINSVPTENIRIPKQKKTIEDIEDVE